MGGLIDSVFDALYERNLLLPTFLTFDTLLLLVNGYLAYDNFLHGGWHYLIALLHLGLAGFLGWVMYDFYHATQRLRRQKEELEAFEEQADKMRALVDDAKARVQEDDLEGAIDLLEEAEELAPTELLANMVRQQGIRLLQHEQTVDDEDIIQWTREEIRNYE